MRLAILQPAYLPWIGYFDQIAQSDAFVFYDDVQFDKQSWQNRNQIKTPQGTQWLSVPVHTRNKPQIKDILIDNHKDWRKDHLKSIQVNYSRAPFFEKYIWILDAIYSISWERLAVLDTTLIELINKFLGIETPLFFSSKLDIPHTGQVQRLIDICQHFGANEFLEGSAGRNYLSGDGEKLFQQNGIKITYHDYQHPVYFQQHGEFVPYLSVIDLLFNNGTKSLEILTHKKEMTTS